MIVATSEPSAALLGHELRHVAQYERIGLAFLPLYLRLLRRHGYQRHPLEREAQSGSGAPKASEASLGQK